jgi:fumarate reductase subunit C
MPAGWWLKKGRYFMYMMRELSAVFVALWVVLFLAQLPNMAAGPQNPTAFGAWQETIHSPGWVLFSLVTLVFVVYHAWTWFNLMGAVIYLRAGKLVLTGKPVTGAMLLVWAGATVVIGAILVTPAIGG